MKEKNNLRLFIFILIFVSLLIVGLAFGINKLNEHNKEKRKDAISDQLINFGIDENEAINMDEGKAAEVIQDKIKEANLPGYIFNANKDEYRDTNETMSIIDSYIAANNWNGILTTMSSIKDVYNFTTVENRKLITAYNDANMLIDSANWTQTSYDNYLTGATNSEIFLKIIVSMPGKNYLDYYLDSTSLIPIYLTDYNLSSQTFDLTNEKIKESLKDEEYYDMIKDYVNNYSTIEKIKTSGKIDKVKIEATCYVGNNNGLSQKVIGCYNHTTDLFTVAKWANIKSL